MTILKQYIDTLVGLHCVLSGCTSASQATSTACLSLTLRLSAAILLVLPVSGHSSSLPAAQLFPGVAFAMWMSSPRCSRATLYVYILNIET